jgi:hypothetical protein
VKIQDPSSAGVQSPRAATVTRFFPARSLFLISLLAPLAASSCAPQATDPVNRGPDAAAMDGAGQTMDGAGQTGDTGGAGDVAQASANSQACQSLRSGSFMAVTGVSRSMYSYSNPGPLIQNIRQAYRVTLPSAAEEGNVTFKVPQAGEYVIFASRPLPITVFTLGGSMIAPTDTSSSVPECPEVKSRESFNLIPDPDEPERDHRIRLGPDSTAGVDVVITQGP